MSSLLALTGGILIGLAAALMYLGMGRVAGISGIIGSLFSGKLAPHGWRVAFIGGLLVGGLIWSLAHPANFSAPATSTWQLIVAGLLVGFGSRLGGGCTSGHGVCGVSRLSIRSVIATFCFVLTGVVTVALS